MFDVNSVSNKKQKVGNSIDTTKNQVNNKTEFSSYLEKPKTLDDIFEKASKKYNVSVDLLKAIGKTESNFDINAVSRSGAQGVMQLMPATAKYLGVKDSFDPEENIMAGSKYIADLLDKYNGDTKLALAAYNAGSGNVAKYGGIPPFKETQNYVVKVTNYLKENIDISSISVGTKTTTAKTTTTKATTTNSISIKNNNKANTNVLSAYNKENNISSTEDTTTQNSSSSLLESLDSIFSYYKYLEFLSIFLDNGVTNSQPTEEESKDKNNNNYLDLNQINYNGNIRLIRGEI